MVPIVIKVVDPSSRRILGPNEVGEVRLRGPNITIGYFKNPKATREAINGQDWLYTGDMGYYDEDGYFYVTDRIKELIKYKAYQVAPAELEDLLLKMPGIEDAAVVGVPDLDSGELPKAYVVKAAGSAITAKSVQEYIAGRQ